MGYQMSLFDIINNRQGFKIDKQIRLIELFAGYGSQHFALEYLKANFESWKICEWAVKSIQAYKDAHFSNDNTDYSKDLTREQVEDYLFKKGISANYNEPMTLAQIKRLGEEREREIYNNIIATHNLVSVVNCKAEDLEIVDRDKYTYLMTYSFPCQDLSKAGKMKGMSKEGGTRSGMLWQVERILDECNGNLPQVLLMENVPDVIGEKNKQDFAKWYQKLESLGYSNFYEVLNAKDFGIPQNRARCFMVSILGNYFYEFPTSFKLQKRLKDLLENNVSEKYYLSSKQISQIVNWNAYQDPLKNIDKEKVISPTLTTMSGAFAAGMILINEATKKGYAEAQDGDGVYINRPHQKRGVVQKGMIQTLKTSPDVGVVVNDAQDNRNMKEKLCDKLVESGILKENDVVNHSYTNGLTGKNPNSRQKLEDFIETRDGIMPCMTTRPDTLGIVVKDVPLKRGYSVEVNEESPDTTEIDIIGNYSKSNYNATPIVGKNGVAPTVRENHGEVTAVAESLFTDAQAQMFTEEGNVKRYINSDVVDEFNEGQCADISFPNGYNKGPRVHDECPAINPTTTASSFVVKTKNKHIHKIIEDNDLSDKDPSFLDVYNQKVVPNEVGCLKAGMDHQQGNIIYNQLRIRKLTPKECFRLMGVKDEDYERIAANQSNASLYHLAGDSIVVDVLMYIFKQMLETKEE